MSIGKEMNPVDSHENTANIEETHFALENANDLHAKILEDGKLTISANETDKGGKIVDTGKFLADFIESADKGVLGHRTLTIHGKCDGDPIRVAATYDEDKGMFTVRSVPLAETAEFETRMEVEEFADFITSYSKAEIVPDSMVGMDHGMFLANHPYSEEVLAMRMEMPDSDSLHNENEIRSFLMSAVAPYLIDFEPVERSVCAGEISSIIEQYKAVSKQDFVSAEKRMMLYLHIQDLLLLHDSVITREQYVSRGRFPEIRAKEMLENVRSSGERDEAVEPEEVASMRGRLEKEYGNDLKSADIPFPHPSTEVIEKEETFSFAERFEYGAQIERIANIAKNITYDTPWALVNAQIKHLMEETILPILRYAIRIHNGTTDGNLDKSIATEDDFKYLAQIKNIVKAWAGDDTYRINDSEIMGIAGRIQNRLQLHEGIITEKEFWVLEEALNPIDDEGFPVPNEYAGEIITEEVYENLHSFQVEEKNPFVDLDLTLDQVNSFHNRKIDKLYSVYAVHGDKQNPDAQYSAAIGDFRTKEEAEEYKSKMETLYSSEMVLGGRGFNQGDILTEDDIDFLGKYYRLSSDTNKYVFEESANKIAIEAEKDGMNKIAIEADMRSDGTYEISYINNGIRHTNILHEVE